MCVGKFKEDGVRHFTDPEDRKHLHFGIAKSEIPKGGKFRYGAQLTSSRRNGESGISMMETPK
jgi:hypothetical protein